MKKIFFCVSLVLTGLLSGCVDKNELVDEDNKPSWLGGSIYGELKSPKQLTGTFNTYLRLVEDLGYAEIFDRTGSVTVFPANDEAFSRFFASNRWGVSRYEDLSTAQKKLLLMNSMLGNSMLVRMLSNAAGSGSSVTPGGAMKHPTSMQVIDTIQHLMPAQMPQNNKYWDALRGEKDGIYVVSDATDRMMVHFTREHMLVNGITTLGDESDFAIITGTPYTDGMAYVFGNQIVKGDVTCQNGYIHQMGDVIVPPGNMAQEMRDDGNMKYFSHIVDYFSAPYVNTSVTNTYNAWAEERGLPTIDKIYEVRYLNDDPHHRQVQDPNGVRQDYVLKYDLGWNRYSPTADVDASELSLNDVGAIFAPTDQAMVNFFTKGGDGAYLIDLYGCYPGDANTEANLIANLDTLYAKKPGIINDFVRMLMQQEFTKSVPSKFITVTNDVQEYMGVTLDLVNKKEDGKYDIRVANNGVIYKMNTLLAPDKYQSVMAPTTVFPDMTVFNRAVEYDKGETADIGLSFNYYLMAMKANYAFFIPDDEAFQQYYVDVTSLGKDQKRALKFSYDPSLTTTTRIKCVAYEYDPATNSVGDSLTVVPVSQWKSLFVDILNYHTVVLGTGETFGQNKYYKTKHGGEICISGTQPGATVMSGQQIDNGVDAPVIENVYNEKNGTAFRINQVIQAPVNSVSKTLQSHECFTEFYDMCDKFSNPQLLKWAGISDSTNAFGISEQDGYIIFDANRRIDKSTVASNSCLDKNVKMFNTYNYTLYAPNNEAMKKAYADGLPSWDDVLAVYQQYEDDIDPQTLLPNTDDARAAAARVKTMITRMRDFVRYHFQTVSVYADNVVESRKYNSLSTDALGLANEIEVTADSGSGKLYVKDGRGNTHVIDANDTTHQSNLMARDYWFDKTRRDATSIYTSSFCVVHELNEALYAE